MNKKEPYYRLNAARCLRCEQTLVATIKDELHKCGCGNLIVSGNRDAFQLLRYVKDRRYVEELSEYNTGHRISIGHACFKPQSALEELRGGKWFIQSHLHGSCGGRFRYLLDDYGQKCEVDEVEVGNDACPWTKVFFRFCPVRGMRLESYGEITHKSINFHRMMLDTSEEFIATGQTKADLARILLQKDFQDRSGMDEGGKWR